MTLRDLLTWIGQDPLLIVPLLGGPPILAFILSLLHGREAGNEAPWKYLYSVLIYAACIPGLMATVVTTYALVFAHENLLDLNAFVYVLPIVSMIATLIVIGRVADFDALPGFGRLAGLMTMIGLTFVIIEVVSRLRLLVFFGGSIWTLVAFGAFVFALLKWGSYMAFRRRGDPEKPAPRFPGVSSGSP